MDVSTSPAVVIDNETETSDNVLVTPTSLPNPTSEFSVMDQFMLRDVINVFEIDPFEFYHLLSSEQVSVLNTAPRKCVAIGCRFCLEKGTSSEPNAIIIPRDLSEFELLSKIEGEFKCHCESCDNFPDEIRNQFDEINDWDDYTPNHIWRAALQQQNVIETSWTISNDGEEIELNGLIFAPDVFDE